MYSRRSWAIRSPLDLPNVNNKNKQSLIKLNIIATNLAITTIFYSFDMPRVAQNPNARGRVASGSLLTPAKSPVKYDFPGCYGIWEPISFTDLMLFVCAFHLRFAK